MKAPSTIALLRISCAGAWLVAVLLVLVRPLEVPGGLPPGPAARALAAGLLLAFAAACWASTGRIGRSEGRAADVGLLLVQAGAAFLTHRCLLVAVALQAPLLLRGRLLAGGIAALLGSTAGLGVALAASGALRLPPELAHLPPAAAFAVAIAAELIWLALALGVGQVMASESRERAELARANAELQATRHLLAVSSRMAERLRISRDLHDAVGHHLAALSLGLEVAALHAGEGADNRIREARAVAQLLLADVREAVSSLRRLPATDLAHSLELLVAGVRWPRVHLAVPDGLEVADPEQAHAIFRCAQEGITNALRHARATNLWIEVARRDGRIEVRVSDDGRGAAPGTPGAGLRGMRERLGGVGGDLEIDTAPGAGFRLTAWVPLGEAIR